MTQGVPAQAGLDHRLIEALFEVIPEDWRAFRLTVTPGAAAGAAPVLALFNPDVAGTEGTPSEVVRTIAAEVLALLAADDRQLPQLSYSGHLDADGEWHLRIIAPLPARGSPPAA